MDVVEFFKTVNRLRKNQRCCKECPIHKNDDIPQSAPEHGICRGDSRMTQLQEAIHNKITTYSEDE